jgi:hypothetical protein
MFKKATFLQVSKRNDILHNRRNQMRIQYLLLFTMFPYNNY